MQPIQLYFDSGAFSAWRKGNPIKVEDYIDFCRRYPQVAGVVALDVIPGQPGRPRSDIQVEEAAEESWHNYVAMREAGIESIPVYHMGERRYWLEKMIDEGATYIGLGGVARSGDKVRRPWLDSVFTYLCGNKGYPSVKVHGFGVTSSDLVHRYPWYSTDSISWMLHSAYGFGVVPRCDERTGKYDFGLPPYWVGFSSGSNTGKVHYAHLKGNHYEVLGSALKSHVDRYLEEEGFTVKTLHDDRQERVRLSLRYYKRLMESHKMLPFIGRTSSLFRQNSGLGRSTPIGKFRMMFTISPGGEDSKLLNLEGLPHRLLAYTYFIDRNLSDFDMDGYLEDGIHLSVRARRKSEVRPARLKLRV